MSFIRTIFVFGTGFATGYGVASQTNSQDPFIKADSSGVRVGDTKVVDISEDNEKIKILNIFEFNNDFLKKK